MKKPTAGLVKIILSVICAAMILGVGVVYAIDAVERNQILGEEEAKTFAYLEAGITDDQVESCRIELEKKAEGYVYELDFIANGKRLEYTVLADNGLVINKKEEYLKSSANSAKKKDSSQQASAQESQISAPKTPTQEAAEQKIPEQETIAQKTTAQKTTVQEASTKKTPTQEAAEQKMPEQETTKQETSTKEANTQQESITYPEDQRKMISIEEVKNIALSVAGVDATGANFTKLKYEKKSGTSVYDLEFYLGNDKHMLIVRADDGVILTHEVVTGSQQSDEEKHQVSDEHPDEDDDDDDHDDDEDDDDEDDDHDDDD